MLTITKALSGAKTYGRAIKAVYGSNRFDRRFEPKATGIITAIGTWALLLYIGLTRSDSTVIIREIIDFFTFNVQNVHVNDAGFLERLPVIFLAVAIELPLCLAGGMLAVAIVGKHTRHAVRETYDKLLGKPIFKTLFVTVFLEELIFRYVLVGVITGLLALTHGAGFYVIVTVSNIIFALVHLGNYKEPRDRQAVRTLPQFIGGLMFTFVFFKYGLVASTLAHFASNAVIFSGHKLQRFSGIDIAQIVLHGLLALISWSLMDKPMSDTLIWFSGEPVFALEGWETADYMLFALFVSSIFNLVADLLLYDKNIDIEKSDGPSNNEHGAIVILFAIPVAILMVVGTVYFTYWVLGFFTGDVPLRVLVGALLLVGGSKNYSLSSAQRAFWVALPNAYLLICITEALGFVGACWYMLVMSVIGIPQLVLKYHDD